MGHPIVIRCLSLVYGSSQSCQLLEAGLRGLCDLKKLTGPLLKVISEFRLIDNFLSSYNKKDEMIEMKNKVELIMQSFNLPLKEYDTSAAGKSISWQEEENIENLLGMRRRRGRSGSRQRAPGIRSQIRSRLTPRE